MLFGSHSLTETDTRLLFMFFRCTPSRFKWRLRHLLGGTAREKVWLPHVVNNSSPLLHCASNLHLQMVYFETVYRLLHNQRVLNFICRARTTPPSTPLPTPPSITPPLKVVQETMPFHWAPPFFMCTGGLATLSFLFFSLTFFVICLLNHTKGTLSSRGIL